ncbi:hypothetical protein HZB60_06740 [candidate division KSB1 bacterium]|nr:hypothetical protein [candidate division KSB1 bacterium]
MKRSSLLLLLAGLVASLVGCEWQPVRDNTVDPASPYYQEPPPVNHAPSIDTLFMITDCRHSLFSDFCAVEILARITDVDQNIDLNAVIASIEMEPGTWEELGHMAYDPARQWFIVRKTQSDFPDERIDLLVGKPLRVQVSDAQDSTASRSISFVQPVLDWPVIVFPFSQDTAFTNYPRLSWIYWNNSPTGEHSFSVSVLKDAFVAAWDTAGLAPSDTFVIVTDSLPENNFGGGFYTWDLTVTDGRGNRVTSAPGDFVILVPARAELRCRWGDWIFNGRTRRRRSYILSNRLRGALSPAQSAGGST